MILICFITASLFKDNIQCDAMENKVFIIYDKSKEYGSERNLLNELVKCELSKGKEIKIAKMNSNNIKNLGQYDEIYVLNIEGYNEKVKYLKDKLIEDDNKIHWIENYSDISKKEIVKSRSQIYLYLDNVTPLNDLNDLIDEIDYLKSIGIKFFIEVSSIFINEDLEAMVRFSECLRYAQANGGKVILKSPIISEDVTNINLIQKQVITERTKDSYENYIKYLIYPVGMSIYEDSIYNEGFKNILESTDSLFLNAKDKINIDVDNYMIKAYKNIIQKITLEDYLISPKTNIKNAITIESKCTLNEFKRNINKILNKEIIITDCRNFKSYMKFQNQVDNNLKGIFLNNKDVTQNRFISKEEYESNFNNNYDKENIIKKDLAFTNMRLEIVSGTAIIIFLIILVISKNIERKRFFK